MGVRQSKAQFNNNMIIEHLNSPFTPVKFKSSSTDVCYAKYNYRPKRGDELELRKGDKVFVIMKEKDGWWKGESNGKWGWFPCNYVDAEIPSSPDYVYPEDVLPAYQDLCRDAICTVRTLYQFQSQSSEELSFDEGIILDIIDKPKDDPDWWKARTMRGKIGLVPRNYVKEINSYLSGSSLTLNGRGFKAECSFVNADWFHGALSRKDCQDLLMNYGMVGEFLLRDSETKMDDYSLSLRTHNEVKHFRIKSENGFYSTGHRAFNSMEELIAHYKQRPLLTTANGDKIRLTKAFSKT